MTWLMPHVRTLLPRSNDDPVFWLRFALVVVAQFAIVRAVRYGLGRERLPLAVDIVSSVIPIEVWGVAWLLAGLVALYGALRCWPLCSLPTIGVALGFAVGYTITWLNPPHGPPSPSSPGPGDYVSASSYWTVALLLVPGYFLARGAIKGYRSPGLT